ncbi:MAG TPA: WYL domain-containing protein [Rhizomicrobium sp.]|jgi:predicted DNA-binding transcriptional regulator YafY|nr:WYL domain-containing protein [Rhizomicrobium sp.]
MLASRLLSILMLLQTRGRISAPALAREFEVSVRTIHRDIDQLSAAGIPVYADRGRSGGFQLMDGYRTKLTGMTQSEAEALLLAGLPGPAAQLGLSDLLSAARLKLLAALPANVQRDAERIASRFHLDPVGWFRGADPLPALQTVAQAVWAGRYLKLRYRNNGEVYPRRLGPLGLVLKGGVWYLVAQSGKAVRTYRVAQICEAEIADESFALPRNFDLANHWQEASSAYEAGLYREHAQVRLSPRGMTLLDLLGPFAKDSASKSAKRDRRGWILCTVPIESIGQGAREFMRLGEEIEVLGPPALRARIAEVSILMAKRHLPKPAHSAP